MQEAISDYRHRNPPQGVRYGIPPPISVFVSSTIRPIIAQDFLIHRCGCPERPVSKHPVSKQRDGRAKYPSAIHPEKKRSREPHLQPKTAPKSPHIPRFPAERPTFSDNPVLCGIEECGELTAFFPFICFPQLPATAPCRRLRPDSGIIAEAVEIIGVHPSVPLSAKKARTHEQPQRSASRALHGSHPYAQARSDNRCRSMTRGSDKSHTVHKPIIIAITVASLPLA